MGVIQYRRGERFDRVIVNPRDRFKAADGHVPLNTLRVDPQPAKPEMRAPSLIQDQAGKLSQTLSEYSNGQIGELGKMLKLPPVDAAQRTHEQARTIWQDVSRRSKRGSRTSVWTYIIFFFIAFQMLRACGA